MKTAQDRGLCRCGRETIPDTIPDNQIADKSHYYELVCERCLRRADRCTCEPLPNS